MPTQVTTTANATRCITHYIAQSWTFIPDSVLQVGQRSGPSSQKRPDPIECWPPGGANVADCDPASHGCENSRPGNLDANIGHLLLSRLLRYDRRAAG